MDSQESYIVLYIQVLELDLEFSVSVVWVMSLSKTSYLKFTVL